jgi:hypothetical protein
MALRDTEGADRPTDEAWADGGGLILIGHRNCKTTRQTIPFVDRIHRRRSRGRVVVVLQDDADTALALRAEQKLEVPLRLEADPYPLTQALGLVAVPTLFFVDGAGTIVKTTEAFHRADLEDYAARLGVPAPLFTPEDKAPAFKPG